MQGDAVVYEWTSNADEVEGIRYNRARSQVLSLTQGKSCEGGRRKAGAKHALKSPRYTETTTCQRAKPRGGQDKSKVSYNKKIFGQKEDTASGLKGEEKKRLWKGDYGGSWEGKQGRWESIKKTRRQDETSRYVAEKGLP